VPCSRHLEAGGDPVVNPDVARIGDTWQIGLFKTNEARSAEAYQGETSMRPDASPDIMSSRNRSAVSTVSSP
jgi:hypothetical protein